MPSCSTLPTLTLPHFLKPSLSKGHPWVYRDHVPKTFRARNGTWVRVKAGNWTGYALWDMTSPIALRVFSQRRQPDAKSIAHETDRPQKGRRGR